MMMMMIHEYCRFLEWYSQDLLSFALSYYCSRVINVYIPQIRITFHIPRGHFENAVKLSQRALKGGEEEAAVEMNRMQCSYLKQNKANKKNH